MIYIARVMLLTLVTQNIQKTFTALLGWVRMEGGSCSNWDEDVSVNDVEKKRWGRRKKKLKEIEIICDNSLLSTDIWAHTTETRHDDDGVNHTDRGKPFFCIFCCC